MADELLPYTLRGTLDASKPIIFWICGWPDRASVFLKQVDQMPDYRHVLVEQPNFSAPDRAMPRWSGWTFEAVAARLANTIRALAPPPSATRPPVVLVSHDWGCAVSYKMLAANPTIVDRFVPLDIGQHVGKLSISAALMVVAYQLTLVVAWLLPRVLGDLLTRTSAKVLGAPFAAQAHQGMNYYYLVLWKTILFDRAGRAAMGRWNPPVVPTLYLYGEKKPFFFHSKRWLDHLNGKTDGSKTKGFSAGHWFFRGRQSDEVTAEIKAFVEAAVAEKKRE